MLIVQVPYNAASLSKRSGQEDAPQAIVESLPHVFLSESGMPVHFEQRIVQVDNLNIAQANQAVFDAVLGLKDKAVLLGGDHGLTFSAFAAFAKSHPGAGLVVFDAHPDCESEDYLRMLIERGHLSPDRVILVGIRNSSIAEHNYIRQKRLKVFSMAELAREGIQESCDAVMAAARAWPSFYLSIDIDAVDPAFAPGTGYREVGGLTSRELLYFVSRLRLIRALGMADIVEVNPRLDRENLTVNLAAKLVWELA